ncbi:MAG: aldo/keto reductase [Bacteroidales bacterium]|jgi:predicted aldo/keto reductase-like oxidoreductase|nr:aldo/keto reductase [Bacteroidales bacterium]
MNNIKRRRFIKSGIVSAIGVSAIGLGNSFYISNETLVDKVQLGKTGLTVPRIAMGTGTVGYNNGSNQTRLGMDTFVKLAHHAYERGMRFYDMADGYGSHTYVREALKTLPRENITLLTKISTRAPGADNIEPVENALDRFRQETGSDYFDIVLMHGMSRGNWSETRKYYIDGLSKAKQNGIVKAVGISCHNLDALAEAADSPWVDVILARINPFQSNMDGAPEAVSEILGKAQQNGKGVIGMKIFGQGEFVKDEERERSIRYALTQGNVHCMTLGLESIAQMDDAIERVMRAVQQ